MKKNKKFIMTTCVGIIGFSVCLRGGTMVAGLLQSNLLQSSLLQDNIRSEIKDQQENSDPVQKQLLTDSKEEHVEEKPDIATKEPDTELGSYTQIINRTFPLPRDYVPEDLVVPDVRFSFNEICDKRKLRKKAADALEELFAAAQKDHIYLYGVSGYRSYSRQSEIYYRNLFTKGAEYTNQYSAMPGTSEHQSGLAIDLSCESVGFGLTEAFSESDEGLWLKEHAWEYGWIIRYDKEMSDLTGYAYEPWHIRYVGKKLAKILYSNHLCLEQYYGCD